MQKSVRLTTDGRLKMDPVYTSGGKEVVYTLQESLTRTALMRLNVATGTIEALHPQAKTAEFEPAFSADGHFYAYVQSKGNLNLHLIIRDTKLDKEHVFNPGGGFAGMRRPSIAPDNGRVIFGIPGPGGQQIAAVTIEGKDRQFLTKTGGINNWPAFSPDGKEIAFASSRDGNLEIYVMKADGSEARRLTRNDALDIRPVWSPDGKRLAFTSNRDGNYEIYVMNSDGSAQTPVTRSAERDDYPSWHPGGKHVVYVAERAGKFDLYQVEVPA